MEFVFVAVILGVVSLAIVLVITIVAGLSALAGASFGTVFMHGLWALALPPMLVLYGWLIGKDQLSTNHVEIGFEHLPASFEGYRIVHISDMHLRSFRGRKEFLEKIVDRINAEKPDLIAFTGDIVTTHPDEMPEFMEILKGLSAADGIVSVMGNHDYCPYNDWSSEEERDNAVARVQAMEKALGWNLLDNANLILHRTGPDGQQDSIAVIGVENISAMKQFETRGDLSKAMSGISSGFKILLSHDPTYWRAGVIGATDIDLTLSGHTHNAQCRLLGLEPSRLVFRENSGLYSFEASSANQQTSASISRSASSRTTDLVPSRTQYLYVNDGLGETLFPARIGVPAEITVIDLALLSRAGTGCRLSLL